jgi:nitroimidazol reductase NimA-like FMN-containing flavoprotein (pyridoxamine 5'-phosphate oxidase superfamily)
MLGELNLTQVENVLNNETVGRIGCHADGITYVVPVTYAYDGQRIYAHSAEGMKIDMMRKNPEVCFEVDTMQDMANWQSVIAWGKFEEITGKNEKKQAMQKLIDRLMPLMTSETAQPSHGLHSQAYDRANKQAVIYRIWLNKKTGRFEKGGDYALLVNKK